MDKILEYIRERYHPLSLILYGSYADGSNNENSDFDALAITESHEFTHDMSLLDGVPLDLFVYPRSHFGGDLRCEDFEQLFDGKLLWDTDGIGAGVKERVVSWLNSLPGKSPEENRSAVAWCRKMLLRAARGDAEGAYRRHWVLTDSLEIFCDLKHRPYRGPKKALRQMQLLEPEAFALYETALCSSDDRDLERWIACLETLL